MCCEEKVKGQRRENKVRERRCSAWCYGREAARFTQTVLSVLCLEYLLTAHHSLPAHPHLLTTLHFPLTLQRRYEHHVSSGEFTPGESNIDTLGSFLEVEARTAPALCGPFGLMPLGTPWKDATSESVAESTGPETNKGSGNAASATADAATVRTESSQSAPAHVLSACAASSPVKISPAKKGKSRPLITPTKTPRAKGPKQMRLPLSDRSMLSPQSVGARMAGARLCRCFWRRRGDGGGGVVLTHTHG